MNKGVEDSKIIAEKRYRELREFLGDKREILEDETTFKEWLIKVQNAILRDEKEGSSDDAKGALHPVSIEYEHTGGGCFVFYGECDREDRYFALSTDCICIYDKNPEQAIRSGNSYEFENAHTVKELKGLEYANFGLSLVNSLEKKCNDYTRIEWLYMLYCQRKRYESIRDFII